MTKSGDNKIGIPWYKRNVKLVGSEDMGINPISFSLPNSRPKTEPRNRMQPQEEPAPATQPATQPATNPVKSPFELPVVNPFPLPIPERKPNNPNPNPVPNPAYPKLPLVPDWTKPNYDWVSHFEKFATNTPAAEPAPAKEPSAAAKAVGQMLVPLFVLFAARKAVNDYVEVNVTTPIYNQMLKDPVLGTVLREAEKANMDAGTVGTILANFDWENGDYKELEKSLAVGVGAAGAARLLIFIVGRKVVFRL